jgi:hypothetical protein
MFTSLSYGAWSRNKENLKLQTCDFFDHYSKIDIKYIQPVKHAVKALIMHSVNFYVPFMLT